MTISTQDVGPLSVKLFKIEEEKKAVLEKIVSLESERKEHNLVLSVLEKVEPGRRCCRLVGGALVPHTAEQLRPCLQDNVTKIGEALEKLCNALERLTREHEEISKILQPLVKENIVRRSSSANFGTKSTDTSPTLETKETGKGGLLV